MVGGFDLKLIVKVAHEVLRVTGATEGTTALLDVADTTLVIHFAHDDFLDGSEQLSITLDNVSLLLSSKVFVLFYHLLVGAARCHQVHFLLLEI